MIRFTQKIYFRIKIARTVKFINKKFREKENTKVEFGDLVADLRPVYVKDVLIFKSKAVLYISIGKHGYFPVEFCSSMNKWEVYRKVIVFMHDFIAGVY